MRFACSKVEVETTDGGSSRQGIIFHIIFFLEVNDLVVEEKLSTVATLFGCTDGEEAAEGVAEADL